MVTSTQKNLDSVSIECMQLHHLSEDAIDSAWKGQVVEYIEDPPVIEVPPAT